MLDAKLSWPGLFLLMVGVVAAGCGEPQCPKGFFKKGDTCYRIKDAGADGSSETDIDPIGTRDAALDGSREDRADGEAMDIDAHTEPTAEYALGQEGMSCPAELEQTLACSGHTSGKVLKCQQGVWIATQTCAPSERCDSRVGTEQGKCSPVPAACLNKAPGDVCDGTVRVTCGIDLITLANNPCPSHAHCAAAGGVRCECDIGWPDNGQGNCANNDDCPANACAGGTCVDGLDDYSCNCPQGYAGTGTKQCTKVDYCPKDACTPGGTCIDRPDWSCQCNAGFAGTGTRACTNINDCVAGACSPPGGTCEDGVSSFSCECNPGYSGDSCENDICSPNPCRNGGTCSRTGTLCECPPGFSGANCQVDACSPNPCQHGGRCTRTAGEASCDCSNSGYTGGRCETEIDECASANVCGNPAYPCVQTQAPGYSCQGQFADWPMPDAVAGSKIKPDYDITSIPGAVRDTVTGLIWQRDLPTTYSGCSGMQAVVGDRCTWSQAREYCSNLQLASSDDWRLPSKIELESIFDDTRLNPAIDLAAFPGTPTVALGGSFWSGSPLAGDVNQTWLVGSNGASLTSASATALMVRCVRSFPGRSTTPSQHYTINTASTVDNSTGLIWQRSVDSSTYTAHDAITHCSTLGGGWRLPTKKELLTIVDPTRPLPNAPVDPAAFPNTPLALYWTSSPSLSSSTPDTWVAVDFSGTKAGDRTLGVQGKGASTLSRVRCVR